MLKLSSLAYCLCVTVSLKAAALGALSFYLDHYVEARIARYDFGVQITRPYNPMSVEHSQRVDNCDITPSGEIRISGGFSTILSKVGSLSFWTPRLMFMCLQGTVVEEKRSFSRSYCRELKSDDFTLFKCAQSKIKVYTGPKKAISWVDEVEEDSACHCSCSVFSSNCLFQVR